MSRYRLLFVFGTRPEAIKLAPVILKAKKEKSFDCKICITAQHRELLDDVLHIFNIKTDYDLNIMIQNQTLEYITTQVLNKMKRIIILLHPDIVILQGDTTSAFATAIACYYQNVPVAHVESGLRTHDIFNPYPEEINRVFIDRISDICFAPTKLAYLNLTMENINPQKIFITGNTVVDALKIISKKRLKIRESLKKLTKHKYILLTSHRRESFGEPHKRIFQAIKKISESYDIHIIYPVHPNPNVHKVAYDILKGTRNVHLISPVNYFELLYLMKKSYFIITDSGGIQEEAPVYKKPLLVIREKIERPESVIVGVAELVGTDTERIFRSSQDLIEDKSKYKKMSSGINPYGDGRSADRIVSYLKYYFGIQKKIPEPYISPINSLL